MVGLEGFEHSLFRWKFIVSTTIWWIQQSKRPNFVHIGRLCRLSAGAETGRVGLQWSI